MKRRVCLTLCGAALALALAACGGANPTAGAESQPSLVSYEPTITLYPDGTFALFASFYDGSVTISGTYAQEGDGYVLTPTDSTAQGTAGSDVGEITLTPSGGGFAYSGGQLGATYDGAVFLPPQQ